MNTPEAGDKMPDELGAVVDEYHRVRELRLAMDKKVKAVQAREIELREHLIDNLSKGDTTGVAGHEYHAQVVSRRKFRLTQDGWNQFCRWVRVNDKWDMLQHRLADKAVADWYEEEQTLPAGVETLTVPSLSVKKVTK